MLSKVGNNFNELQGTLAVTSSNHQPSNPYKFYYIFQISSSLRFIPNAKASTLMAQNRVSLFGALSTEEVDVNHSSLEPAEDLQNLKLHKEVKLIFTARDCDNQPLRQGGLGVTVDLNYTEADCVEPLRHPVPVSVGDNHNGTYEIRFRLNDAGLLVMNIFVEGALVKVSNFQEF